MRRILTVRGMLRIGRIQRMRGDTKDGENIQGRILRMRGDTKDGKDIQGRIMRMVRTLKVIVSRYF
jgi:hypothetical protein